MSQLVVSWDPPLARSQLVSLSGRLDLESAASLYWFSFLYIVTCSQLASLYCHSHTDLCNHLVG